MHDRPRYSHIITRIQVEPRVSKSVLDTRQLQGELGNRHIHILIFIVIDCTEFLIAFILSCSFSFNKKYCVCEEIESLQ